MEFFFLIVDPLAIHLDCNDVFFLIFILVLKLFFLAQLSFFELKLTSNYMFFFLSIR